MTTYIKVYPKLPKLHFNELLFFNRREKVLKSRGKMEPFPCEWRTMIHINVVLIIVHTPWDMWSLYKIVQITFQCMIVFQSREKVLNSITIWLTQYLRVKHTEEVMGSKPEQSVARGTYSTRSNYQKNFRIPTAGQSSPSVGALTEEEGWTMVTWWARCQLSSTWWLAKLSLTTAEKIAFQDLDIKDYKIKKRVSSFQYYQRSWI